MSQITTMLTRAGTLLLVAMLAGLVLGSGVALAALIEGNNADNTLRGTPRADTIHAYAGDDVVWAFSGRDEIHGGHNADTLYGNRHADKIIGGKGTDHLYGGYGDDRLVSQDLNSSGIGQRDVLDCGPGYDTFAADCEDRVLDNCEEGVVVGS